MISTREPGGRARGSFVPLEARLSVEYRDGDLETHSAIRDFAALDKHVSEDKLVLWGWNPGGGRAPVSVPHEELVAKFKQWAAAGGPCPSD